MESNAHKFCLFRHANYSQLMADINATLHDTNAIYAIRVHGFFDFAETRSVPVQTQPYPTIVDAVKNQTVFTLNGVEGTAVGFYFPNNMDRGALFGCCGKVGVLGNQPRMRFSIVLLRFISLTLLL
jgi:alpha-acetolactate decarboxylase